MEAGRTPAPSPTPRLGRAPTQLTPTMRTQRGAATGTPQIPVPQWGPTTCAQPGRTWAPAAQPHGTPLLSPQGLGDKAAVARGDKARVAHGDEARVARGGSADGQQPWHCPSPRHTQPPTRPAPSPAWRVVPVPAAVSAPWGGGSGPPPPHTSACGAAGAGPGPAVRLGQDKHGAVRNSPLPRLKTHRAGSEPGAGGSAPPAPASGGSGCRSRFPRCLRASPAGQGAGTHGDPTVRRDPRCGAGPPCARSPPGVGQPGRRQGSAPRGGTNVRDSTPPALLQPRSPPGGLGQGSVGARALPEPVPVRAPPLRRGTAAT